MVPLSFVWMAFGVWAVLDILWALLGFEPWRETLQVIWRTGMFAAAMHMAVWLRVAA